MSLVRTLLAGTTALAIASGMLAAGTAIAYVRAVAPTLPDHLAVRDWQPREGTAILARDGSTIGTHARERRSFVSIDDVPARVIDAFLAAEDANFWTHSGIDPAGVARALVSNVRAASGEGRAVGGSTITQQVVKNVILGPERSLDRKVREAVLALRLERDVGKRRILEVYLNEIYFGAGAYGLAEAARTYFDKTLRELTLAESAILAGLPKAPGASDPIRNPARARERRDYVLGRMLAEGWAGAAEVEAAIEEPIRVTRRDTGTVPGTEPAFAFAEEEARRRALALVGQDAFYGSGGAFRTTLDPTWQRAAHAALRAGLVAEDRRGGWRGPLDRVALPVDWNDPRLAPPAGAEDWSVGVVVSVGADATLEVADGSNVTFSGDSLAWAGARGRADRVLSVGDAVLVSRDAGEAELAQMPEVEGAFVAIDPRDGSILALDGGFSFERGEFNRATQARRQTGSVFKTFVYLAALEMGYDATSPVLDSPIAIDQGPGMAEWRPTDAAGVGEGLITLRRSLETSKNMSAVRLLYDIGADRALDVAARVGLPMPEGSGYAVALGAAGATPLEVAAAYATVANGGRGVAARLSDAEAASPPAGVDPVAAAQVTSILRGVVTDGTARRAFAGFEAPIAAKTGTTNDSRDAWLVAYGPNLVAVAWVGRDDNRPLARGASGGGTAGYVVRGFLDRLGDDASYPDFLLPDGATEVRVDSRTGDPDEGGDLIEIMRAGGDGR